MGKDLDRWFVSQILPHEEALIRYLARHWPHREDIHDLRQEAYIRVYQAAAKARPLAVKSFLFSTARNLLIDRVRRARIVPIEALGDLHESSVPLDELSPERRAGARQELQCVARALDELPPRCREVVWMRKVEGLSQKETAARLGVAEKTIEKHVAKGVRALADALLNGSRETSPAGGLRAANDEPEHGQQHTD